MTERQLLMLMLQAIPKSIDGGKATLILTTAAGTIFGKPTNDWPKEIKQAIPAFKSEYPESPSLSVAETIILQNATIVPYNTQNQNIRYPWLLVRSDHVIAAMVGENPF